ncbi:hypothetical protein C4544_01455 [candidate division WS5 bacterium]|uniref:Thioredoxin domain-containing protein n=1 Tax=candidate division WS5 bacterium TaxID=2093353 RepID=A0A419DFS9_9BACT|nr:MAG: hypothetical protein C4544_01455 [candidate division WS5 bacterium]
MKIAIIIIVILAGLLAVAVFYLQQDKNNSNTENTNNNADITSNTQEKTTGAGTVGKNEKLLTDDNFKAEVEDYEGVVLVDFYLSTCPHCQNVAEDVTAVSDELVGKAKVGKMDARAESVTSDKYKIESVPTFIVFKNGKEVERISGEKSKQELINIVNKHL